MSVPRWGIHEGIKYSPRRSILKVCPICNSFFLQFSRGKKKYCKELCYLKAKKSIQTSINKKMIENRDTSEHADYMRDYRSENPIVKKVPVGTDYVPNPELKVDGSVDWDAYHELLHNKLNKLSITTLSAYHTI